VPESYLQKMDCTIIQDCNQFNKCKATATDIEITLMQLVSSNPSFETPANGYEIPKVRVEEEVVWIDFALPSKALVPLPVWYPEYLGEDEFETFRLSEWLEGTQESPYDYKHMAFVFESSNEDDETVIFRAYKKTISDEARYISYGIQCLEIW